MKIFEHYPLKDLTTFRTGGKARYFASPKTEEEVMEFIALAKNSQLPFVVLGGGSNVLIADGELNLCVMSSKALDEIKIMEQGRDEITISVGAGVTTKRLLAFCLENSITGAEFLTGIPGTLGGAFWGNAGAQGKSLEGIFSSARVVTSENCIVNVKKSELKFEYRHLTWNTLPLCVLSLVLTLKKVSMNEIKKNIAYFASCKKGQPIGAHTAGCVFKNPGNGLSSGRLIDQMGGKELSCGGAIVSPCHANFIENKNGATSSDIYNLSELIRQKIKEKFGINLEYEIKFIGRP